MPQKRDPGALAGAAEAWDLDIAGWRSDPRITEPDETPPIDEAIVRYLLAQGLCPPLGMVWKFSRRSGHLSVDVYPLGVAPLFRTRGTA